VGRLNVIGTLLVTLTFKSYYILILSQVKVANINTSSYGIQYGIIPGICNIQILDS